MFVSLNIQWNLQIPRGNTGYAVYYALEIRLKFKIWNFIFQEPYLVSTFYAIMIQTRYFCWEPCAKFRSRSVLIGDKVENSLFLIHSAVK